MPRRSSAAPIPISSSRASAAGRTRSGTFAGFLDTDAGSSASRPAGSGSRRAARRVGEPRRARRRSTASRSLFLQDEDGQILEAHSISAGLDYPGVGPEHAHARRRRAGPSTSRATDDEALAGFQLLSATEGIVPALEPAHAIGWLAREAGRAVPAGLDRARHAVGPGRQGRGAGRRDASRASARDRTSRRTSGRGATAGRKLLVPYVTGGLGAAGSTSCARVADAGADAVEIGIPFSDPVMDGRTIQEASQRALELGATPAGIIAERRPTSTSTSRSSVMTYYNPVAAHGPPSASRPRSPRRASPARSCPTSRSTSSTAGPTRPTRAGVETVLLAAPHHARRPARARSASGRAASSTASR